jgi:hypothetical protein
MNNGTFIRHVGAAQFLLNTGSGDSDFGPSLVYGTAQRQIRADNQGLVLGASFDVHVNWNGSALEFDPVVGVDLRWQPFTNYWAVGGPSSMGLQFNVETITFGTTAADPTSLNSFVQFAGPNLRAPSVGGEYADVLWTASGSIDIDGLAMSEVSAFKINSVATILNGGSIQDVSTLHVSTMASTNTTRSQALRVTGRSRLDGMVCHKSASPAQITADQDDYTLPENNNGRHVIRLTTDATRTITGFAVALATAQTGDSFRVINAGANGLVLANQDVGSAAANRIISPTGADFELGPDDVCLLWHDDVSDRWRIISAEREPVQVRGYDEVTGVATTNAALEDITGLTFTITIPVGRTGIIRASMSFQNSTTGGSPAVGAWAININSVDGTELQRNLSGSNDIGIGNVKTESAALTAGTYTVVGRHRRVSGAATVNTDVGQLEAVALLQ